MWVKFYLTTFMALVAATAALGFGAVVAFILLEDLSLPAQLIAFGILAFVDFSLLWYILIEPQKRNGLAINTSTGEVEIAKEKKTFSAIKKVSTMKVASKNGENIVLILSTGEKEARVGLLGLSAKQKEALRTALPRFRNAEYVGTTEETVLKYLK